MSSNGESGVGAVIFLLGVMWLFGMFKSDDHNVGVVSIYPLMCSDPQFNGSSCHSEWKTGTRGEFSVYGPQQTVVVRYFSDIPSAPSRLEHCTVVDRQNWACDGQRMLDGTYTSDWVTDGSIKFVSWWQWWLAKLKKL